MPALELFLQDQLVGEVTRERRDRGLVNLTIDPEYRQKVLLSEAFAAFPGRSPSAVAVSNFLGGYVPEGNQRERMAAKRHIDKDDLFALLTEFGGSVAGAVTLRRPGEPHGRKPSYEVANNRELTSRLKQALKDSDQGIPDDSRSTLPGYQPKVLVALLNDQWMIPHGRAHSTHILKPQVPSRPSRIFDEHYSHLLTQHMGLSEYDSQILTVGGLPFLAIERFDRAVSGSSVSLFHQEDLAQALGLDWRDTDVKFQDPEWPTNPKRATARVVGELLGSIPGAQNAVETWVRQVTYNVAIGNNDAHAKNVALMHLASGAELSPIYDAVPNLFQEGLIQWNLALSIDGHFDQRRISVERILSEVSSWEVMAEARAAQVVVETLESLRDALGVVEVPSAASKGMVQRIGWSTDRLLSGKEISEPKRRP